MQDQPFQVVSEYEPRGDQPAAIDALVDGITAGRNCQTLMGVTGSGKTFTMAHAIARINRPTLVISHNKTLAAQLYEEFKDLFPDNAVSYFVSYYDYYQPEAYIPQRDIYIEKDASRNDDLDRLRLATTTSLVSRRDVIVVASVSCIFGLGSPEQYKSSVITVNTGQQLDRQQFLRALNDLQYARSEFDFKRGSYRVRGDIIEVYPANEEYAYRIELFGDEVEALQLINPLTGELLAEDRQIYIYPAVHYVMPENQLEQAVESIEEELAKRVITLRGEGKLLEAQRLTARTRYDLEMIQELGYCSGIENYSRHLDGRPPGSTPYTLLNYFPQDDWLLFLDESHVTIPQLRAMCHGDEARKKSLIEHGFRLPSAYDNRPLRFEEVEKMWSHVVFVSATPGPYELEQTQGEIVEQIIRPTGLVDPQVVVRPAANQVPDLLQTAQARTAKGDRTLVTTLTKRLAEDLAAFLADKGVNCRYLHSDIKTLDRIEILRDLRQGDYDVLVGVNLLREGLDLPEVSLVAIMDADKAGFLRSTTSLIQQIGRAARNVNATVILYADRITPAMQQAIDETDRRRSIQLAHNKTHNITPQTIKKAIRRGIEFELRARKTAREAITADEGEFDQIEFLAELESQMLKAADALEFESAAALRDQIKQVQDAPLLGKPDQRPSEPKPGAPGHRPQKKRRHKTKP
jgi:excinuclease ABC subunit B